MPNWYNQGGADSTWGTGTLNNTSGSSNSITSSYTPEQLANIASQTLQVMSQSSTSTSRTRFYEPNNLMGTTTTSIQTPSDFAVTTFNHGRWRTWIHTTPLDSWGRYHTSTVRLFRGYHHHHRFAFIAKNNNAATALLLRTPAYLAGEAHHYMVRKRLGSPVPEHYLPAGFAPLPGDAHAAHKRHLAKHNKRKAQWRQKVRLDKSRLRQPRIALLQQQETLTTATTTAGSTSTTSAGRIATSAASSTSASIPAATTTALSLTQEDENNGGEASREDNVVIKDEPNDDDDDDDDEGDDDNDKEPAVKIEIDSDDDFDFSALHPPHAFHMDERQSIPVPSIEQDDDAAAGVREHGVDAEPEINDEPNIETTEGPSGLTYLVPPAQSIEEEEDDEDIDAPWSPELPVLASPTLFAADDEDDDETVIKVEPGTQDFFATYLAPASPAPFVPPSPAPFVLASPEPYIPASPTPFIPASPALFVPETPTPVVLAYPAPLVPISPAPFVLSSPTPAGPTTGVTAAAGPPFDGLPPIHNYLEVGHEEPSEWLGQIPAWPPAPLPEYPAYGNHMVFQSSTQSAGIVPYSYGAFGYGDAFMGEPEAETTEAEPSYDQEDSDSAMMAEFGDDSSGEEEQSPWLNLTLETFPTWWEQHGMAVEAISLDGASDRENTIMGSETEAEQDSDSESTTIVAESEDSDIDWGDDDDEDYDFDDDEPDPGMSPDRGSDSDGPEGLDMAYEAQTGVHSIEVEDSEYGRALAEFYDHSGEQYWADDEGGDAGEEEEEEDGINTPVAIPVSEFAKAMRGMENYAYLWYEQDVDLPY
ncbi:transcription initiation factor TFIIA large subunit [Microdochium nivale]|nr:transcription initiation factor TFIIA large subunit [Microdochium nivale]